jgi:hypothetical protein
MTDRLGGGGEHRGSAQSRVGRERRLRSLSCKKTSHRLRGEVFWCLQNRSLPAEAYAAHRRQAVFGEVAVVQAAAQPIVHRADVGVPLRGEPPVEQNRSRFERAGARRQSGRCEGARPTGRILGAAREVVLPFVVVGTGQIKRVGNRVGGAEPCNLEDFTAAVERRAADLGAAAVDTVKADKISGDVSEAGARDGERIAGIGKLDPLVSPNRA